MSYADELVRLVRAPGVRRMPHSNRFKRLRRLSRALSQEKDEMGGIRRGLQIQLFWRPGCPRALYRSMKRAGWGGTKENLQRLVLEQTHGG